MKKLILMLATIGAITFSNAQTAAPANGAKPAATPATPAARTLMLLRSNGKLRTLTTVQ